MSATRRFRAVLGLQKKNYPHLLGRGKAIHNGLAANPTLFAAPNPSLATILGRIQALDQAQQAASTHAKGTAAARDVRAGELVTCLESVRAYVQEFVDASPEQGAALIEAAAMTVAQRRAYAKPLLQARQSHPSSAVQLTANVGVLSAGAPGKVFFNWQSSADGGKTWTPVPSTPHGRTEIESLTPMVTYAFRVGVTHGKGAGEWSQAVSLLVL